MKNLRRTLVGLVATSVVGTALVVTGAGAAHATVGTVDTGTAISRSAIVERALSWTTEPVPYSQSAYYPAAAARTGTGHSYRQDCSGFVSMAWNLPSSAITSDFVSSSSPYDTRLSSYAALQRGDLLGTSGHVVLFLGWSADDAGRHRYFDMASEAHTGTDASVATDQDLDGYWSTYAPYADKRVVADTPRAVVFGAGRTEEAYLTANGHVALGSRTTGQTAFAVTDLTAAAKLPILRTAPAIVSPAPGSLVLIGTGQNGALLAFTETATTGWTSRTLTTSGTVYGIDATSAGSRIDIVGRQVGSSTADGTGTLWHATLEGTAWSGWQRPGTAPPAFIGDPAVSSTTGVLDTVVESSSGTLLYGVWKQAGSAWSWSAPFGAARVSTTPSLTRTGDGSVVVTATVAGAPMQDTLAPGATAWTGWSPATASLVAAAPVPAPPLVVTSSAGHPVRTAR